MPRHSLGSTWVLHYTGKFILAGERGTGWEQEGAGVRQPREEGSYHKHTGKLLFSPLIFYRGLLSWCIVGALQTMRYMFIHYDGILSSFSSLKIKILKNEVFLKISHQVTWLVLATSVALKQMLRKVREGWGRGKKELDTSFCKYLVTISFTYALTS